MAPRSFHPGRAAGCSICKTQRRAEQLASERTPLADLIEAESALLERAKQRALATVESIDRALSDEERSRVKAHETAALAEVQRALFDALCGPGSAPPRLRAVNSAFELEAVRQ